MYQLETEATKIQNIGMISKDKEKLKAEADNKESGKEADKKESGKEADNKESGREERDRRFGKEANTEEAEAGIRGGKYMSAEELIEKAVRKAIREYTREEKQERKSRALYNTKLLLKNYNKISSSVEEAVSEISQLEKEAMLGFDDEEDIYINSIRRSKVKSLIILAHIDKALLLTKEEYKQMDMQYKYEALYDCLINGVTFELEAEALNTSPITVRRWMNEVVNMVSIRIFGSDGLEAV